MMYGILLHRVQHSKTLIYGFLDNILFYLLGHRHRNSRLDQYEVGKEMDCQFVICRLFHYLCTVTP